MRSFHNQIKFKFIELLLNIFTVTTFSRYRRNEYGTVCLDMQFTCFHFFLGEFVKVMYAEGPSDYTSTPWWIEHLAIASQMPWFSHGLMEVGIFGGH
jgi:hypothetical protein